MADIPLSADGCVAIECMDCGITQHFHAATVAEAEARATQLLVEHGKTCPRRN